MHHYNFKISLTKYLILFLFEKYIINEKHEVLEVILVEKKMIISPNKLRLICIMFLLYSVKSLIVFL